MIACLNILRNVIKGLNINKEEKFDMKDMKASLVNGKLDSL